MARATAKKPDISEDRAFQERFWTVERVAWVVFALLIIGAVAGAFGSGGPLASGTATMGESRVTYPTMARWEAGDEFSINLFGGVGERTLVLSSHFPEVFRIEDIQPQPERVESVDLGHAYVFTSRSDAPIEIHLSVTPRAPGYSAYAMGDGTTAPVRLSTFVWP